ncbi:hypothetical protein KY290_028537 [Solanum tuberosum]|uniref:NB-ARC domain-containing protein n=1 Tax=Solanum tuberosum TaxID=4113 RepID=A0ABQ7ULC1_SOLTU|nr:hypothetical protein KY290_028537 [Solanum tuberosum]
MMRSKIKEDDDVVGMLRKSLIGNRYLIVLDDIRDVKTWGDMGMCFPKCKDGSRVMVTTRIEQVAKHSQHHSDPYYLISEESCPPNLLEASLWREAANDLNSFALGEQSMKVIQSSSYDHLEDHIKCCFLHLGLFPEDRIKIQGRTAQVMDG